MKWKLLIRLIPKLSNRLLYHCVLEAWARASVLKYTDKTPDEISIWDCLKYLDENDLVHK